jgi:hypothetical protein
MAALGVASCTTGNIRVNVVEPTPSTQNAAVSEDAGVAPAIDLEAPFWS